MEQNKKLPVSTLIKGFKDLDVNILKLKNCYISKITCDSREVTKDALFVAIKGEKIDGASFIDKAIEKGAKFIIYDSSTKEKIDNSSYPIPVVKCDNPRLLLSMMAKAYYEIQPKNVVAVTGTNGKTSTANFCNQMWNMIGFKGASIGTIGITSSDDKYNYDRNNFLTTPDSVKLHKILRELADNGITHLAMEASSHGLEQYRLHGVKMKAVAFTNLSRDHLDYHKTEENYFNAKLKLFTQVLGAQGKLVLNRDVPEYNKILDATKASSNRVLSYGFNTSKFQIHRIKKTPRGQTVQAKILGKKYEFDINLFGQFQVYNLLCAMALVYATGGDIEDIVKAVPKIRAVDGRMQRVVYEGEEANKNVFIDYSHTPDALEKALKELLEYKNKSSKLWVVFGCGGDRDKGKRPLMGEAARATADEIVITDDNPRNENPQKIRSEILKGCPGAINIGDRKKAIEYAIGNLKDDDILLIAGKGHERTQTIGEKVVHFDDYEIAKGLLEAKK